MQPARLDLPINTGTTYRDTVRLMQPTFVYRAITSIAGAPVQVTAPAHGLASDWPVWVRGVTGMPDINRALPNQRPHKAKLLDANTFEINALSAEGLKPLGGQLVYRAPVDLTGAVVVMRFVLGDSPLFTLTDGAGLVVNAAGGIARELTAQQTEQLSGAWSYSFEITFSDGSFQIFAVGTAVAARDCGGHAMPSSSEHYLITWSEQGPPGGGIGGGVSAFNDRTGTVFLTGEDVTTALGYTPAVAAESLAAVATSGQYADLLGRPAIPAAPADIGAATAAQGALADTAVQPDALASGLALKVDKAAGYGLSQANFTVDEKSKLAGLESSRFKGLFASLAALQSAFPTASAGDYADVDAGPAEKVRRYIWDDDDNEWVAQAGSADQLTSAQVKALYESNPDTNAFTGAEKTKLAGIAAAATANPDTDSLAEGAANLYHTDARARAAVRKGIAARTVDASGTITPADMGGIVASTSDTPITLTVSAEATAAWAADGWPNVDILQLGTGAVTVAGDGFSITLHEEDTSVLAGPGAAASLIRRAADSWQLIGRLVAA